jgi:predicted nucleotidyltransferase
MDEPHARVAELAELLEHELGADLLGLYVFGSLAAGGFVDGRSDVDLLAVLDQDVDEDRLPRLKQLHDAFAAEHPAWVERVEVCYVSRAVLQTLGATPGGRSPSSAPANTRASEL